jgi:toxin ParE1/3/4
VTGYRLSPLARADLSGIWDHPAERWGEDQAETYIRLITGVCADLVAGRKVGKSIEAVRAGYFRHSAGSHVIFYRFGDRGEVEVIRILHQRMDIERHL